MHISVVGWQTVQTRFAKAEAGSHSAAVLRAAAFRLKYRLSVGSRLPHYLGQIYRKNKRKTEQPAERRFALKLLAVSS